MTENKTDNSNAVLFEVSKQIEKILVDNQVAIHPMLSYSPEGIIPTVRLISTKEITDDKETDKGKTGSNKKSVRAAKPKST